MEENITIEFVRNWIVKHRLTIKSYESVLTDALTNNGHYYIDNPYLRDWIIKNTEMFRNILPYELNENQQVVLEWLKWSVEEQGNSPMDAVYLLVLGETLVSVSLAYIALTPEQQTQVLTVFSKEVAE